MVNTITNPWFFNWVSHFPPFPFALNVSLLSQSTIEFDVRLKSFPQGWADWLESMTIRDLMLCAGLLTSSATHPMDLSAWGFFVEHSNSLRSKQGHLRVVDTAKSWDSRIKALFSERLGMGSVGWLLWKYFDVVHIADAGFFIGRSLRDPLNPFHNRGLHSLGLYGKNGHYKPDFFCITKAQEAVIAESKGAFGPPSSISLREKLKAKNQVKNVQPVGISLKSILGRLTFSMNLRHENDLIRPSSDSSVIIEDPDSHEETFPVSISADEIAIYSYSKFLNFCGLGHLPVLLWSKDRPLINPEFLMENAQQVEEEKAVFLSIFGEYQIGLLLPVMQSIFSENISGVAERVENARTQSRLLNEHIVLSDENLLVLPNGIVVKRI